MKDSQKKILKWAIMVALVLTWGSSYILMKRGLEEYTAMQVGALRIGITFIILLPMVMKRLKMVPRNRLWLLVLSGFIGNGIPAFLFAQAQKGIDSEVAGILNSVAPLFTLVIGAVFFRFRTHWLNIAGVFIGLAGAVGLLSVGTKGFDENFSYGIYIIIATMLYAANINLVKTYYKEIDAVSITVISYIVIGMISIGYLLAGTDFINHASDEQSLKAMGYVAILALAGTAIAGILYNYMIKISSVLFAASVAYIIPIVAIMWGVIDGEIFYKEYIFWILLIFAGVFLVNREKMKSKTLKIKK
ncbi:MAG: DMT family transporter [Bacteroidota bacterium]